MYNFDKMNFCEDIIKPYKEQLLSEALAEIYTFCEKYDFGLDPDEVLTEEELEEIEAVQQFEIYDTISYILHQNGFPVYDDLGIEDTDIL